MARKIRDNIGRTGEGETYPWLRLLELEVQPAAERTQPRRGRGRPPSAFPRKAVHVTLTEDELASLDELADLISAQLELRLHRGHLIAFLVFYLRSRLQKGEALAMPPDVDSLSDLAKYLDKMK
jgi:hypothetical protein